MQLRVVIDVHRHYRPWGDIRWLYFFTVLHELRLVRAIDVHGLIALHQDENVLAGDLFERAVHGGGRLIVGAAGEVSWGIGSGAPPVLGVGAYGTEDEG
jgi:hypothetical protein